MTIQRHTSIPGEISWKMLLLATIAFVVLDFGLYLLSSHIFRKRDAQPTSTATQSVPGVDDACWEAEQHIASVETEVRAVANEIANETSRLGEHPHRATTRKQLQQLQNQGCIEWRPCDSALPCQH